MISGINSGSIISSLTGMIWGGFSEKTGTWAAPGTKHGKSRVDPGKTETNGRKCLSRTAYRSGTSRPKNGKYFRVYSRENLLDLVWGYEYQGDYRTVDVHIRRLREKLELDPANPKLILTKWGVGYYLRQE